LNKLGIAIGEIMKRRRIRILISLQNCILFSEIGKHGQALNFAIEAAKLNTKLIYDSLALGYQIIINQN
jgi:hypothetical protein